MGDKKTYKLISIVSAEMEAVLRESFMDSVMERLKRLIAERDLLIVSYLTSHPKYYRTPSEAMLDGDECVFLAMPSLFQIDTKEYERYDFAQAFLRFPRALPVELKGIAV